MNKEAAKAFILGELMLGLPSFRTYHSVEHTLDVHDAAMRIGGREGISGEDLEILATAALFHDAGFLVKPEHHEGGSCMLAQEHLPRFGYTPHQVQRICALIMATAIPQAPEELMARVLCDADLDYLGRDDFFIIGDRLFHELTMQGELDGRHAWNRLQENFLVKHVYHTDFARRSREQVKQKHLAQVRQWLLNHQGNEWDRG
ncbi:MAG TPA: HD domain-containing protein [Flavobacteriales bacterium]|nr:HD domain-containing protein [Flavobacteriales bacterium]